MTRVKEMVQQLMSSSNVDPKQYTPISAFELLKAEVSTLVNSNQQLTADKLVLEKKVKDLTEQLKTEVQHITTKTGNVGEDIGNIRKDVANFRKDLADYGSIVSKHSKDMVELKRWMEKHRILEQELIELKNQVNNVSSMAIATDALMNNTSSMINGVSEEYQTMKSKYNSLRETVDSLNIPTHVSNVQSPLRKVARSGKAKATFRKNYPIELNKEDLSASDDEMGVGQFSDLQQ